MDAKDIINKLRRGFRKGKTRSYDFRIQQLNQFDLMLKENEDLICDALYKDLHKNKHEVLFTTILIIRNHLSVIVNNLKKWMLPECVEKDWVQSINSAYVVREPYGIVLIISSWNYPIQLSLIPLMGAIAAGNVAILKPSPISLSSTALLAKLIPKYLDNDCFAVIEGDSEQTSALLKEHKFDHIMFTGSSGVGKLVMKAAAEFLTPVTLELGGKSPAILLSDCDVEIAAKRILWGKFSNCGQICLSPDYLICQGFNTRDSFIKVAKELLIKFYGGDPKSSDSYGRIINKFHFDRIKGLMEDCEIAHGGKFDEVELYIEPTILVNVNIDAPIMREEIFGPLLPIIVIENVGSIIELINNGEKPLVLYLFTDDSSVQNKIISETSSGGVCMNDVFMHYTYEHLPFGGVGNSGMGKYHGRYSFEQFSNSKACLKTSLWFEAINDMRYPPFSEKKTKWLSFLMRKKV
ncbi:aldehyde dehydrogenase family 3 member B1-like [Gordionus sp. m RMFG-2023]|uniref:aldehyde dehydrogenase family 3 member B1-like n=1 Tax=Gordionus sp. m RMFG-2023 TaxID=3053472 RepID=UPI0031FCDD54